MKSRLVNMVKYNKSESVDLTGIVSQISKVFKTEKEKEELNKVDYYDTFDWRLFKKNHCLTKKRNIYSLSMLSGKDPHSSLSLNSRKNLSFWWDFPDTNLKNKLKNLIGVRSLIHITTVDSTNQIYKLLNNDEKIIARLNFQKIKCIAATGIEIELICLHPVRGYREEFKKTKSLLSDIGLTQNKKNILTISLSTCNVKPGSYTGKLDIKLKPEYTTLQSTVMIFSNLLKTMKQNEEGIKNDIDTEFLHDFRVAVRRTRAALSQLEAVFPEEITDKAKKEFSTLGKMTNHLRDLDVYLLNKDRYKKMLPLDLHPGLEPVFNILESERIKEQKKITEYLNSDSYKNIINSWENLLLNREYETVKSHNSDTPVIEIAKIFILKKYKKIIKTGNKIDEKTPDTDLHSLRIECKKLRYLLEFFTSLFPQDEMMLIIKQLKKLQDNLGDFNDLCVQQESLKNFANKHKNTIITTSALGGLIAVLFQKQLEIRNEFAIKFEEFSTADNIKLYNKLFS
ncbi:MAG: CHAD domain-containing protein [Thermodesulfobacteriota bacterium]